MKIKLALKLSLLLAALVLVVLIRNSATHGSMSTLFNSVFNIDSSPKINWCADHVVDVNWTSREVPEKLQKLDLPSLRNNYCELSTEAIQGVDLDKVQWSGLAESHGAAGAKTILEWNKDLGLFRSGGLPFKSSKLNRELVDK